MSDGLFPVTEVRAPAEKPRRGTCDTKHPRTKAPCGADLLWVRTRQDIWMPLNAAPAPERGGEGVPAGTVAIGEDNRAIVTSSAWRAEHAGELLYTHHVVSCVDPKSWNQHGGRGESSKDRTTRGPRR